MHNEKTLNYSVFIDTNITFRPANAAFFYPQSCWQIIRISSSLARLSTAALFSSER
ncbi:unknown [Prevotella sp. CAG:520]|nr:unknown [Prevotella sp. CAG:520]